MQDSVKGIEQPIFSLCYPIVAHVEKKCMNHLSKIQAGFEIFPFHIVNNKTQSCDYIIVSKLHKLPGDSIAACCKPRE